MPTFDPSQPYEVISEPRVTRGSTFGDQNGPGSDSGDNGQFAYGGSSVNDHEDYAALPAGSNVPPGYQFPVLNPATGDVTWVTHRDKGPAKWTGRGVDLAPSAMEKLHAQTDDPLVVDTAKAVPPFDPSKPYQIVDANKPPQGPAIPSPTLAQEVGPSPDFVAPPKPEGSVFTDPQARADLVANVKQGLKDFIPTLKQGVATTVPHNREELVSALQDVTQKAAAPYEESMYRTVGPEKYDQPTLDLSSPYAMVPGLPPGLIPELAKIHGPVGDYIRSQVEASPKHEPSGYERFGQAALGAASQLTTPHSAADIYSIGKVPGAQQAFAAERLASIPEQAQRVKQTYNDQGLPEAAATGLNEAIMDILPSLHDAGRLRDAARYADLLPTPEAKPYINQKPGEVYFQPGDAEATAKRATGAQISPEHLQAIAQELQRRDTGLPNLEGEAGSPNRGLESAIEKALRRTTLNPLRSAADLALIRTNKNPVPQLDEKSNDASISSDVQRPSEVPFNPKKEPAQGAETDLAPGRVANPGAVERQEQTPIRDAASMERPGQPAGGAEAGQATSAEDIRGQINTETGRTERGLDPREEVLRREFGKSVELAQKKEANNPGAGRRLVERLEKSPKSVNDSDHVLLARQVIQAQDEYDQAAKEVAANPEDKEAQHAADIADERIQKAYQAYDNAGTGTARGLAIRNVLKAHDYTLPAMEARLRAKALGGAELPYKYKTELKGIHDRIIAADETLGKAYAGLDPEEIKRFAKGVRGTKLSDYSQDNIPALFKDVVDELERAHPDMHPLTVKALAAARVRNSLWRVFDESEQRLQTEQLSPAENQAYDSIAMDEWNPNETLQDISGSRTMAEDIDNPIAQLPLDAERLPDVRTPKEQELATLKEKAAGVAQREEARKAQAAEKIKAYQQKVQLEKLDSEIAYHRKWLANPEKISAPRLDEIRRDLSKLEARRNAIQPETPLYAGLPMPEGKREEKRIARIEKGTALYQAKTAAGDTSPLKPKVQRELSPAEQKALYEREKAKADFHSMIERVKYEQRGKLYRGSAQVLSPPRRVAVAGHGIVFPVTHAGDLLLRPASWGTFGKGFLRTYAATFNKGFHDASMGHMMASTFKNGENAFHLATAAKVDVGIGIGGAGLVKGEGMAGRAWDALKVMRFELWKNQMEKVMRKNPGLSYAEKLEAGKELASWANHATGSGKGLLADSKVGQAVLFGPKLTQSKLNKLSIDPAKTIATFYKMARGQETSLGERVAARTRLSGAAQYATTLAGFLIGNAAILQAMGSKQKINLTDPNKTDFWSFKIAGTDIAIPGLHSEMRYLAQILATTVASRKDLRGEARQGAIFDKGSQYLRSKLSPTAQLVAEGATRQDYRGRPLPWSSEKPTKFLPKYSIAEYAASKAPIPLTGPSKYVFDQMRDKGMSPLEAAETTQALTIFGLGLTGMHVHEDYPEKPKKGH